MSDVATAAKSAAKSPAAKAEVAKPVLTMREVQPKRFPPSVLKALGYGDSEVLTLTAPSGMTFEEVLTPITWSSVAHVVARDNANTRNMRDGVGSMILLDTEDGSYIAHLRIMKVLRDKMNNPYGVQVMCIGPSIDVKTGEARPLDLKTGKAWTDPVKAE